MSTKDKIFILLLGFVPVSLAAHSLDWGATTVFVAAACAIVPLAGWMGTATEELAVVVGPTLGGLLNATFGNATELIIALIALNAGLIDVVKASITGSIIGNLLLVMGLSMLLGGLRYKEQNFQSVMARLNASAMTLAVIAILIPTAVAATSSGIEENTMRTLSSAVAIVLIVVYGLTLLFSMKTHAYLCDVGEAGNAPDEAPSKPSKPTRSSDDATPEGFQALEVTPVSEAPTEETHHEKPNVWLWSGVLLACTLAVAYESELLVESLEEATEVLGLTPLFTGVILVPIVGNAAEHATAITVAMKNKMDLSMAVAMGSSLQIALFVAPVLVLAGWIFGQPMDLNFNPFELVAVAVAVAIVNSVSSDGRSDWLEGALLLATYAVLCCAFFYHPVA